LPTVVCQLKVGWVSAVQTSVSKAVPAMICVGATLNEPGTIATPVLFGTSTDAVN
jgi:hypothetical protein